MIKRRCVLLLSLWAASVTAALAGPHFSFAFRPGYFLPSAGTFNGDFISALNSGLAVSADSFSSLGLSSDMSPLTKIVGAADWGGEVEMFLGPVFSFVAGGGYWHQTRAASLSGSGDFMESPLAYSQGITAKFKVISIYVSARANLYALGDRLRFYAGVGAGCYWCPASMATTMTFDVEGSTVIDSPYEIDSRGSALLPHLNVGADVKLLGPLSAGIDVRYVFGKIGTFKVTSTSDGTGVSEQYYFSDAAGNSKPFVFELNGFNIGLMLKVRL